MTDEERALLVACATVLAEISESLESFLGVDGQPPSQRVRSALQQLN